MNSPDYDPYDHLQELESRLNAIERYLELFEQDMEAQYENWGQQQAMNQQVLEWITQVDQNQHRHEQILGNLNSLLTHLLTANQIDK